MVSLKLLIIKTTYFCLVFFTRLFNSKKSIARGAMYEITIITFCLAGSLLDLT